MFSFACIFITLLLLASVFWLIRRFGRSRASGTNDGGAYGSNETYIAGGAADAYSTSGWTNDSGYTSENAGETFGGGGDFGGGGSGGDWGGGDSGGGDSGGGGDGGGGE